MNERNIFKSQTKLAELHEKLNLDKQIAWYCEREGAKESPISIQKLNFKIKPLQNIYKDYLNTRGRRGYITVFPCPNELLSTLNWVL